MFASLLSRSTLCSTTRTILYTTYRHKPRVHVTFWGDNPLDPITGLEKREILALLSGNTDPFYEAPIRLRPSTRDNPIEIPSICDARMIACNCCEDDFHLNYMWVEEWEEPKRCECGYWFKLKRVDPL